MKKIIFTLFLATFSLIAFGQTITVNDPPFNNCYNALSLSSSGLDVHGKNQYNDGVVTVTLEWNNSGGGQWELNNGSGVTHTNSIDLGAMAPCNGWVTTAFGQTQCGASSEVKVTGGGCTLPVELAAFTASVKANIVTLDWTTASELYNEGFEIQYSKNGTEWEMLDFVEGMGTTYETTHYDYTHEVTNSGTHFYRLMQEDFDGTTSYSDIVSVKVKTNLATDVTVIPNYVVNNFRLTTANEESIYDVQIFDTNGRLIHSITNINANTSIDASDLMSGIYFVRINDGDNFITKRIIKF